LIKKYFSAAPKELKLFFMILALTALGLGFSNDVISNYFKDAYNVDTMQRAIIEIPRELPGLLCIFIIAALSFLGDIRLALISQVLSMIGMLLLGFFTPSFTIMLIFVFINSTGMHMFFPLQDSIGLALAKGDDTGRRMGEYKGVYTAFGMFAGIIVFIGFKTGLFSFTSSLKLIFIISGAAFSVSVFLVICLMKRMNVPVRRKEKIKLLFRKEYRYYYILIVMFGVQKQIVAVFAPWVLIELLHKKADTLALIGILGAFAGIFFMPALGRWLDRYGVKKLLYADALSFILVYLAYGLFSAGFASGSFQAVGIPVVLFFVIMILDKMSMQMGMIRNIYLFSIAKKQSDITQTFSLGISMDHMMSIITAYLGGVVWVTFGPQYIFYLAAALSVVNLVVAKKVTITKAEALPERIDE
jgi:MFS family permease